MTRRSIVAALLLAVAFSIAFYRTAWVGEDAFITFRSIENVLGGRGLTWNIGERVQVFTHPLWFGLLLPGVLITGDPYWTSIALSYALLLVTIVLLCSQLGRYSFVAAVPILALLWSRSFADYSSSGLENPLSHALLAVFCLVSLRQESDRSRLWALGGIASALFLTRPDLIVLIAPVLAISLWKNPAPWRSRVTAILAGGLPAVAWVGFSLFYFGSPIPNTALAKVGTGLGWIESASQAWAYIVWTFQNDLTTALLLASGIAAAFVPGRTRLRLLGIGLICWLAYLFYIGADYMGGRLFSPAVVVAAFILMATLGSWGGRMPAVLALGVLLIGSGALRHTLFSPADFSVSEIPASGIADERGFYYRYLGLRPVLERKKWRAHPWLVEGKAIGTSPGTYTRCAIGMTGYAAGPGVRWIDPLALADPLLARLPARTNARVGHYERAFPAGYLDSILDGRNRIESPPIRALYDDVRLATAAPLLAPGRLAAIWRLNTGHHADAASDFDREAVGLPGLRVVTRAPSSCYGRPHGGEGSWRIVGPPAEVRSVVLMLPNGAS